MPSPGTLTGHFQLMTTSKTLEEMDKTPSTRSARWDTHTRECLKHIYEVNTGHYGTDCTTVCRAAEETQICITFVWSPLCSSLSALRIEMQNPTLYDPSLLKPVAVYHPFQTLLESVLWNLHEVKIQIIQTNTTRNACVKYS